ncbi:hypothetical protein EfsSVR2331_10620 [Enterococcus faecalis]|nr:hypothetical protein EfsSVR2331_10620 [Enterococcus faecalis]
MIESLLVLVVLVVVAYLIVKNYHPALSLIIGALVLLACAWMLGHPIYPAGEGTGFGLFDIFLKFKDTIIAQVSSAGIVIMILFWLFRLYECNRGQSDGCQLFGETINED